MIYFIINCRKSQSTKEENQIIKIVYMSKKENSHLIVLSKNYSLKNKKKEEKLKKKYKNWEISYICPDENLFKNLKLNIPYITIETYFRYVIADIAPKLDKVLYLDADLAVNGSLKNLWNIPLEGFYAAGVRDLCIEKEGHKAKIGFKEDDLYVNAGVLLLNLKKIREDNMVQKLFENTENLTGKIKYQDQDVINITFKNKIKEIDSIYNFTSENVRAERPKRKDAVVIHYTGQKKPWMKECRNKLKNVWQKYNKLNQEIQNKKIKRWFIVYDKDTGGKK